MSGCNYFDYLSPDEIAEIGDPAEERYEARGDGQQQPPLLDELRHLFYPSGTERQAA